MQYILKDDFKAIGESSGTLINISNVPAEISTSESHGSGIILFPRHHLIFNKSIYAARAPGYIGTAAVAVIETQPNSGSGGDKTTDDFTQGDFEEVFNIGNFTKEDLEKVFSDSDFTADGGFAAEDINKVFNE